MKSLTYFFRKIKRNLVNLLKLDRRLFNKNWNKLKQAKATNQELVDVMPGINMPMVIHPDMYFCCGYTKRIFEPNSLDFIRDCLKPGQTVLDIGANVGYFSLFCAKLTTSTGRVIAFEPSEFAFNLLKRNKELNKIPHLEIYKAGLGKQTELVKLNSGEPGMEVYNSLAEIVHPGADPRKFSKVDVQLFNGSEWMQQNSVDVIHLMKLDVEGGEYEVIKGMLRMFQEQKIIRLLIEITDEMSQAFNYHPSDIINLLRECGYSWYVLRPYGRLEPLPKNDINHSGNSHMYVAMLKEY